MQTLGIKNIGESYWMASRYVYSNTADAYFYIRTVSGGDPLICHIQPGISSRSFTFGLRPVFTIRPTVKVTGGNGSENNPWKLTK